jgi:hypothetical protein
MVILQARALRAAALSPDISAPHHAARPPASLTRECTWSQRAITCGLGVDDVSADPDDTVADDCETVTHDEIPVCGDVTGDGKLTATDALVALRSAVGSGSCQPCVCDVNESGGVNASDALAILRAGVGQPVALDCEDC